MTFPDDDPVPESTPTFTLSTQLSSWRAETPIERREALNREWNDPAMTLEYYRLKCGEGSAQYRAALRAMR